MDPGDILVLFSDGVTEAVDPEDHDFGEERLANLVACEGSPGLRDRRGGPSRRTRVHPRRPGRR